MNLYKNVDICDLDSILKKGILSLDESGNNNWDGEKRVNNPTDCVYLFEPIKGKENAFPNYGIALLEVEVDGAEKSEFGQADVHKDDYIEYTVAKVEPEQIRRIIIPEIFRQRLGLSKTVEKMVEWCGFHAEAYGDNGLEPANQYIMDWFCKTVPIKDSNSFNFFRGVDEKGRIIDLYNINYIFN